MTALLYWFGSTSEWVHRHISLHSYVDVLYCTLTKSEVILSDVLYFLDTVWIIRMA